jgi:hypothetical protein
MGELERYTKAMVAGKTSLCISIEERHGLYGYPPDVVSVGLKAFDEGDDVDAAVDAYLRGES